MQQNNTSVKTPTKYLSDYMEAKQTDLFNKTGAFFCFSVKQFNESKKEGVAYVRLDDGMVCPKKNVNKLVSGLEKIYKDSIAQDLLENTKEGVIIRELENYECYYTGSTKSCYEALVDYGITKEEINKVFNEQITSGKYDNW